MMVIRPWRAAEFNMSERDKRELSDPCGRNVYAQGRGLYGPAGDRSWSRSDGYDVQHRLGSPLADTADEPVAEFVRLNPGASIATDPAMTEYDGIAALLD
jgi:hypothetical protein